MKKYYDWRAFDQAWVCRYCGWCEIYHDALSWPNQQMELFGTPINKPKETYGVSLLDCSGYKVVTRKDQQAIRVTMPQSKWEQNKPRRMAKTFKQ